MKHILKQSLKHLPYLALCALAVAGGITLAVVTHRDAVKQQQAQDAHSAAVAAQHAAQAQEQAQAASRQAQDELSALRAQCNLGLSAYNNLTAFAKAHMTKPDCSIQ